MKTQMEFDGKDHSIGIHRFNKSYKDMFTKCVTNPTANSRIEQKWSGHGRLSIIAITQRITLQGYTWKKTCMG